MQELIMKRKRLIFQILAVAFFILIYLKYAQLSPMPTGSSQGEVVKFYIDAPGFNPSVNPSDSDIVRNAVVTEQLVGTLLKERFGNTGRAEPYLIENWSADSSNLIWKFKFRSGLFCEDGTPINAKTYSESLHFRLEVASRDHDLPAFNRLKGWASFKLKKASQIEGIVVSDLQNLEMHFDSPPDGLTEYLAMINFGFYSPNNYKNGDWNSPLEISSSGPYKIQKFTDDGIILEKRDDWGLTENPRAPKTVQYIFTDSKSAISKLNKRSILPMLRIPEDIEVPNDVSVSMGSPIFLTALVLSPKRAVFSEIKIRKAFLNQVIALKRESPPPAKYGYSTESFYSSGFRANVALTSISQQLNKTEVVIGYDPKLKGAEIEYAINLAAEATKALGMEPKLQPFDHKDPSWVSKRTSNLHYDIRMVSVDIGAAPENWLTQMMFCSEIGVSFPDPSGDICKMSEAVAKGERQMSGEEYRRNLENLIFSDAAVVPIIHSGYMWLFGKSIDHSALSQTSVIPRIDLLSINE